MDVKGLKKWLSELPPEMDDADIASAVGSLPSTAKRVIAVQSKDGTYKAIIVNSMGTHLSDDFYADVNVISRFNDP